MKADERIISFLKENTVANICLLNSENKPHCISCFYAFDEEEMLLIFKSGYGTMHDPYIEENAPFSGTILPNELDVLKIIGLQLSGRLFSLVESASLKYSGAYTQKYPMSFAIPGYIWVARLEYAKLTDNSLGFGTKVTWRPE